MPFKELDPELCWKAIEGYTNELSPQQKGLDAFYRQFVCPRCQGKMRKEVSVKHAFSDPNTLVPRSLLRCEDCHHLMDPHTGLDLELGNPARINRNDASE
jgi:hypothetical protein